MACCPVHGCWLTVPMRQPEPLGPSRWSRRVTEQFSTAKARTAWGSRARAIASAARIEPPCATATMSRPQNSPVRRSTAARTRAHASGTEARRQRNSADQRSLLAHKFPTGSPREQSTPTLARQDRKRDEMDRWCILQAMSCLHRSRWIFDSFRDFMLKMHTTFALKPIAAAQHGHHVDSNRKPKGKIRSGRHHSIEVNRCNL